MLGNRVQQTADRYRSIVVYGRLGRVRFKHREDLEASEAHGEWAYGDVLTLELFRLGVAGIRQTSNSGTGTLSGAQRVMRFP